MTNTQLDVLEKDLEHIKTGYPYVLSTRGFNCLTADHWISLPGTCAALRPLIADARLLNELVTILQEHCGETSKSEGAVDTLRRIVRERNNYRHAHEQLRRAVLSDQAAKALPAPFDITNASVSEISRANLEASPKPLTQDQIAEHVLLVAAEGFPADPQREDTWHISDSDLRGMIAQAVEMAREFPPPADPYADWAFHPKHIAAAAAALGLPEPSLMDEKGNPL